MTVQAGKVKNERGGVGKTVREGSENGRKNGRKNGRENGRETGGNGHGK